MRLATVVLVALLGWVHAELWFGRGGVPRLRELEQRLAHQRADNEAARARNERLLAEVRDLKEGQEMVEERARRELGMLKADEILVQFATEPVAAASGGSSLPAAAVAARAAAQTPSLQVPAGSRQPSRAVTQRSSSSADRGLPNR